MLSLCEIVTFGAGWQIARGDADDVRVCAAHPWQSYYLVFANGDYYGTAMSHPSIIGECARRAAAATAKNMKFSPHARQQGKNTAAAILYRMRKGRDHIKVMLKFCCGGAREGT